MDDDVFADTTYGKLALAKIKPTDQNFRLFCAGWMGKDGKSDVMEVRGAIFRRALRGARKGELCIPVPGSEKSAYVTADEMTAFDARNKQAA